MAILYEGGLSTSWRRMRDVAVPAALLSTIGVVVTALVTGAAAHALFDLDWPEAVLLGGVVASTDAAAVFATLRRTHIRRRLARTLEGETGLNDPIAIALTIGLIAWIDDPTFRLDDLLFLLVGSSSGSGSSSASCSGSSRPACSRASRVGRRVRPGGVDPAAALSFGVADVLGGSGFLAVYLVGLAVGSTPSRYRGQLVAFHEGLAFLAQVAMFVVLGLLVFPSDLPAVMVSGFVLALLLAVVIRPVAVWASTAFSAFTTRERAFLGWAGLRGAVPIVLGDIRPLRAVAHGKTIFNAVFFVVLVSALLQGTTLERVAGALGLHRAAPRREPSRSRSTRAARSTSSSSTSRRLRDRRRCRARARPAAERARRGHRARAGHDPAARQHAWSSRRPALVLIPHGDRAALDDVFSRWRRRVKGEILCCPDKFRGSLTAARRRRRCAAASSGRARRRAGTPARRRRRGNARRAPRLAARARGTPPRVTGPDGAHGRGRVGRARRRDGGGRDGARERPRARPAGTSR